MRDAFGFLAVAVLAALLIGCWLLLPSTRHALPLAVRPACGAAP